MPGPPDNDHQGIARLTARLLGPVSLALDGREMAGDAWPRREGRALLLLLVTPGQRLLRERVYDALWPDLPPDAARNAYYKALHGLRHTLEPELRDRDPGSSVVANAATVALVPEAVASDVDTFEMLLERARTASAAQETADLEEALAIYRGELLAEEHDCDWAAERRRNLRDLWQRTVLQVATFEISGGQLARAIPRLDAVLATDPLCEEAHRLLIRAYDRMGRRDLARRQYGPVCRPAAR